MANPNHVAWLQEGVEAWNRRRRRTRVEPDLSGADLRQVPGGLAGADLRAGNLAGANAEGVDLTGARLAGAYAVGANFARARMQGADLQGIELSDANLSRASLDGARLTNARLSRADLGRASLVGADLRLAYLRGAFVGEADLSDADVRRYAPSSQHAPRFTYLNLVRGMTERQAASMRGDRTTTLPDGFALPESWEGLEDHDAVERPPVSIAYEVEEPAAGAPPQPAAADGREAATGALASQVRLLIRAAPAAEMTARGLAVLIEAQVTAFRAGAGNEIPDEVLLLDDLAQALRSFGARVAPAAPAGPDATALEAEIARLKGVVEGLTKELEKVRAGRGNAFVTAFLDKGGAALGGTVFGGLGTSLLAGTGFLLGAYAPEAVATLATVIARLSAAG